MADVVNTIVALGSIAATGSATVTLPQLPIGTQLLQVQVGVLYAAVATAGSGVTVGLKTSVDGSTFVTANETAAEIAPAATVLGNETINMRLGADPFRQDAPAYLNTVRLTLTNTDATNAATYTVSYQALSHQA